MFALSTAWNADRWVCGTDIAKEINNLGIKKIELNFSLTENQVKEIAQFSRENNISITSLHNYCPMPDGLSREEAMPDCFSLSAADEDERQKAVMYTKRSISTAQELSARALVLHTGRVEIEDKTRELIALHNNGESKSDKYKEIFNAFVQNRNIHKKIYIEKILLSLEELYPYAKERNILLGVENRFYYREIPTADEYEIILDKFKDTIGYWHDVGHAFIHEQLGFMKEEELLKKYGERLIGFHLHNVKNLVDHQAPTNGDFDFNKLKPYMKKDTMRTIESHKLASSEDIKKSTEYLSKIFPD